MRRVFSSRWGGLVMAAIALLAWGAVLRAADTETRLYTVQVGDKPAGEYHVTIEAREGALIASCQAQVQVKRLLGTYTYSYGGSETWKDGRLCRLEANSNDDGKRHTVSATSDPKGLVLTIDGNTTVVQPDVWTTTYWQLPAGVQPTQTLALLDVDTGTVSLAKLDYVGLQAVGMGSEKPTSYGHYRLSGSVAVDLWYDGQGRLVHQESIEEGQRTVIHLTQVQR